MGQETVLGEMPPDPFQQRIGQPLADGWKIERLLGAGGMAAVYRVRSQDGQLAAAKILHASMARIAEVRARFMQEAQAVSRLQHRAIVRIFDSGRSDDGCPFLIMELLEGESLAERIERAPMDTQQALQITADLLDVLALAHASHIIHRDIKPDNVFLLPDGSVKLLDFGVARVRRQTVVHVVTRQGTALGTPHYMPQEQIKGVGVDHRADLFSVAAMLFELLTGRTLQEAEDHQSLMVKMLTLPAPPLSSRLPDAPPQLCAVVDLALAFEAEDRYPDAATMLADVRGLLAGQRPAYATTQRNQARATAGPTVVIAEEPASQRLAVPAPAMPAPAMPAPAILPPATARPQALGDASPTRRLLVAEDGQQRRLIMLVVGGVLLGVGIALVTALAVVGTGESESNDEPAQIQQTAEDTPTTASAAANDKDPNPPAASNSEDEAPPPTSDHSAAPATPQRSSPPAPPSSGGPHNPLLKARERLKDIGKKGAGRWKKKGKWF